MTVTSTSSSPRVSIIMPAYNCEAYVAEAIESIINQTFTDWELLVADDGSTDNTRAIIDRYEDPRIRRFHSDVNIGLVPMWNKLIQATRGELVAWQDADDYSLPERIEKLVQKLDENPDVMLCGCNSIRVQNLSRYHISTNYPLEHKDILRVITLEERLPFTGPTRIVRREVFNTLEGFRYYFHRLGGEDIDFVLRVAEKHLVANIPESLYVWRYTRGSSSRRTTTDQTFLKLYIDKVAFFLADQRQRNQGLDGLMEGGNKVELEKFVQRLRTNYEKDKSMVYRRACLNKISNQDYWFAFVDATRAVRVKPSRLENYTLYLKICRGFLGNLLRRVFHK